MGFPPFAPLQKTNDMRPSTRRSLSPITGVRRAGALPLPPEQSWHDYAVFLLHVAAEIEHSLMVQYLYAAYSLGGASTDSKWHEAARQWREVILGIAKEEMGHLITVQNIIRLIGGPLHLDREAYPYRSGFYPFPFALEPLTKNSLAKYVVAESPKEWQASPAAKEIMDRAAKADDGRQIIPVGRLYEEMIQVFENHGALTDDDFRDDVGPYEATWDEWGRGYGGDRGRGERGNLGDQAVPPDVLVIRTTDRASALEALRRIARQGEAPEVEDGGEPGTGSHFHRFLKIYEAFPDRNPPSRNIPTNPTADESDGGADDDKKRGPMSCARITNPRALGWAHLFNIRYRKLLYTLKHAFHVAPGDAVNRPTARGNLIAWTFGEMYNLRSIAAILVTLPLKQDGGGELAGPPFELPYSLTLPDWDSDKWRVHRDLIAASANVIHSLDVGGEAHHDYLRALRDHDKLDDQIVARLFQAARDAEGNA